MQNKNLQNPNSSCYGPPHLFNTSLISIHSEDRDILKWPSENCFEVELPYVIKNVDSVELFDINLPTNYNNISKYLQNNSLWFTVPKYFTEPVEIEIPSGNYSINNLTNVIQIALNQKVSNILSLQSGTDVSYNNFTVIFNAIQSIVTFLNSSDVFEFYCGKQTDYDTCKFNMWDMIIFWGLPYNLGFYRETYISTYDLITNSYTITSPDTYKVYFDNTIYMELDKFNYIDEIDPFTLTKNRVKNYNDSNGKVNSSFAKLILSNVTNVFVPVNKFKRVLTHVEEKVSKIRVFFRNHNGVPVDFSNQPLNFSLLFSYRYNCSY
jgi:hypothetical protein